jgi:poly [ADP-ribose] polymerase
MFGKGVYFSDMVSKSANYCHTSKSSNTGLMLLCEVALGNMNSKYYSDYYASNLPVGMHSTKAFGKMFPDGGQDWKGLWVPNG